MTEEKTQTEIFLYSTPEGKVKVETILFEDTLWLSQKRMAELFGVETATINEHIKKIYKTHELEESSTIRKFLIVQIEGYYRRLSRSKSKHQFLQSRPHHLRWLPRKFSPGHPIPKMGNRDAKRVYH